MLFVIDRENDQEYSVEVTHVYSEEPEPGFNGYIEIEFIVVDDDQKDITNQFNQTTLDDMEKQLIVDITSENEA